MIGIAWSNLPEFTTEGRDGRSLNLIAGIFPTFCWRTLPACLNSRLYLVYNLSWGENPPLFTPPTWTFHHSISTGLIWLIDFEDVFKSFTVQTYFFVMRHISCTNSQLMSEIFWPTEWNVGREKIVCCCHRVRPHKTPLVLVGFWNRCIWFRV